jgi:hypothetical protein
MRSHLFLIASTLLTFLASCSKDNSQNDPILDFQASPVNQLKGSAIKLESDSVLYDPRTLQVFDSVGVLYDNNGFTGFSIINLKNGRLIRRFAETGSGDNKFNINSLRLNRVRNSNTDFTLYETSSPHRIFKFNLNSLIKKSNYYPELLYGFPSEFTFVDPVYNTDSTVVGNISFSKLDDKVFGLINLKNDKLTTGIALTPTGNQRYKEYYDLENIGWTKSSFHGNLAFRPSGEEFAIFSNQGAWYQIAEARQNELTLLYEKLYYFPEFHIMELGKDIVKAKPTPGNRYGFNNITVTQKYIYTLFNGKKTETTNAESFSSNTVLVYDWSGKPVRKLVLDQSCYQIAIDPFRPGILYGLTAFKHIGIHKYNIEQIND